MTKRELFKKYEERYVHTNKALRKEIRKLLMKPEGILLVAGIQEFFEEYLDGRTKDGVSYKN